MPTTERLETQDPRPKTRGPRLRTRDLPRPLHLLRRFPCSLILLFLAASAAFGAGGRATLPVEEWRFQPGRPGVAPSPGDWVAVRLPYTWTSTWLRPKDAASRSWAGLDLRDVNSAWYEADVTVPADWQGRRLFLDLRGVQCDAVVWAGERRVGEVKGPDGRLDLTGVAAPGQAIRLRLWVTRWWEGTANQRSRDPLRDAAIRASARTEWYPNEDAVRKGVPGGISEGVSLQSVPAEAEITDVVVRTSVRRKELQAQVDVTMPAAAPDARLRVQVTDLSGSEAGLPGATVPLAQPAGRQTITIPWANPHLWELGAGHLYLLKVGLLDAGGQVLDAYPDVRFGFREVWAEGRELMLNGHPARLRLGYFTGSVTQMLFFEGMGFNAMEFQPNPSAWYATWGLFPGSAHQAGTRELLDAADEHGWGVLMPVPGVSYIRDALMPPEAQALYRADLHSWLRQLDRRNRPSILMWTPSMNTQGYPGPAEVGRNPTSPQPAWFAKVEELIRGEDPTRLIFHHQGGQVGDVETANLYLNFLPLAEQEEFFSAWSQSGEKPWGGVEHGSPLTVDFFKWGTVPLFTEYGAIYFGDAAYAAEREHYIRASLRLLEGDPKSNPFDGPGGFSKQGVLQKVGEWTAYYRMMDLFIRGVNKAWRAWGVNGGMFPWFFDMGFGTPPDYKPPRNGWILYDNLPGTAGELRKRPEWANPLQDAYRETMQPLLAYLGGPLPRFTAREPRYTAGEEVRRSLIAVWDGPGSRELSAHWELTVAGKIVSRGDETLRLGPGAIEKRPIRFTAPVVTTRTPGVLELSVRDAAGATVAQDQVALTFFPHLPKPIRLASRWGLYDPAGATAKEWVSAGLSARVVPPGGNVKSLDVLVVGSRALDRDGKLPFTADDVRRGLRVLLLEQSLSALEAMGFRAMDTVPRYVFPRVPGHPALAGLTAEDLANWRGEGRLLPRTSEGMRVWPWPHGPHWGNTGSVASVVIETPHRGAFTPLLECEFDLAYSPLLLWRHGRGQVLFSQLDLTGRLGSEPAAGRLARNLLRALDAPTSTPQEKSVALPGDNPEAKALLSEVGVREKTTDHGPQTTDRGPAAGGAASLEAGRQVLVVAPGCAAEAARQAKAFATGGGSVLVMPQSPEELAAAGLPWRLPVVEAQASRVAPGRLGNHSLLRGIGPQLLHWRTFLAGHPFAERGLPPGAERLADGWILRVPQGKGEWVFCQVDWRRLEGGGINLRRTRWNTRKLYRQLLTNLGAGTDEATAAQLLAPRQFAPMVPVALWQVLQQAGSIPPTTGAGNTFAGLAAPFAAEAWVQSPDPAKRRSFTWRLAGADKNGFVDLRRLGAPQLGRAGYAVTHLYSSVARTATLAVSADYWMALKVNGAACLDQAKDGRAGRAPAPGEVRLRVPLRAGWNRLEVKVASGSGGFGFWCSISDPGDLRVSPTLTAPDSTPGRVPAPADLRREPLVAGDQLLYTEALLKEDDPYGFTAW